MLVVQCAFFIGFSIYGFMYGTIGLINVTSSFILYYLGVKSVDVNLEKEQVIVESTLPSDTLKNLIESTGKRAVIKGYGGNSGILKDVLLLYTHPILFGNTTERNLLYLEIGNSSLFLNKWWNNMEQYISL